MKGFLLIVLFVAIGQYSWAVKKSTITATIKGFSGKEVYFDFIQQPDESRQFAYVEGETISFEAELQDITMLKINSWVWICLKPGDSITVDLVYEGRNYKAAEFSGEEDVVKVNEALRDMRMARVKCRYKMDIDAAAVTLVPADKYHLMCMERWKEEIGILNTVKNYMPEKMYNFLLSEHESIYLGNFITYPYLWASFSRKVLADILPKDYWTVLDNYNVRGDKGSLHSSAYMGFLLPYADYVRKRELVKAGKSWEGSLSLRDGFDYLTEFYDKNLLDAALCVYLHEAAAKGEDFDVIDELVNVYLKKYNKNKEYKKMLLEVMQ